MRPELSETFFGVADLWAERSTCERGRVGAVLTRGKRTVATGYNGAPPGMAHCSDVGCEPGPDGGCVRTVHAEANVIAWAARHGVPTQGCEMWCTHSPCLACAKLMVSAGITTVHFRRRYRDPAGIALLEAAGAKCLGEGPAPGDPQEPTAAVSGAQGSGHL